MARKRSSRSVSPARKVSAAMASSAAASSRALDVDLPAPGECGCLIAVSEPWESVLHGRSMLRSSCYLIWSVGARAVDHPNLFELLARVSRQPDIERGQCRRRHRPARALGLAGTE